MMKNLLSNFVSTSRPKDIVFETISNGKIKLKKDCLNSNKDIDFNLSHSDGMIAFAIGEKCSIGIDIEKPGSINQNLVKRCFHPLEISWIEDQPQALRGILASTLWSIKEAFGKAVGVGIYSVLKEPVFIIRKNLITFYETNKFDEQPKDWTFKIINLPEGYIIAIAVKGEKNPKSIKLMRILSLYDVTFTQNLFY